MLSPKKMYERRIGSIELTPVAPITNRQNNDLCTWNWIDSKFLRVKCQGQDKEGRQC